MSTFIQKLLWVNENFNNFEINFQETTAQKRVAKVIGVIPENLDPPESSQPDNYDQLKDKGDNLDRLVDH